MTDAAAQPDGTPGPADGTVASNGARAGDDEVVARPAVDHVVAGPAVDGVVAVGAAEGVVAVLAVQDVAAALAQQHIVALAAVGESGERYGIVPGSSVD